MDGRIVLLLRAVNLGPHNRVPMPVFRDLLTGLGARDVVTYLASGQAVADIDEPHENFVERVHKGILDQLGLDIDVFSRTPAELADIVRANPFPHLANTPRQLHVAFLDAPVDTARIGAIGRHHGQDELAVGDRAVYLVYTGTMHDSPLGTAMRRLGGRQTARNWTTVTKLAELSARG